MSFELQTALETALEESGYWDSGVDTISNGNPKIITSHGCGLACYPQIIKLVNSTRVQYTTNYILGYNLCEELGFSAGSKVSLIAPKKITIQGTNFVIVGVRLANPEDGPSKAFTLTRQNRRSSKTDDSKQQLKVSCSKIMDHEMNVTAGIIIKKSPGYLLYAVPEL